MYNNSSATGNIGEAVAIAEFTKRGITVLLPFGANTPYDLVIQLNGKFYRVQCKTTAKVGANGAMRFRICRTNGFTGNHLTYSAEEIDYFFLYCVENGYMALVPVEQATAMDFIIRLQPAKNAQRVGVHLAKDFSIEEQLARMVI